MSLPTMDSFAPALTMQTRTVGPAAAWLLELSLQINGRVSAVFPSTVYIAFGDRLVCIGSRDLAPGPLSLVTDAPAATDWRACGIVCDETVALSCATVHIGNRFRIALSDARRWLPPGVVTEVDLPAGLAAFRNALGAWGNASVIALGLGPVAAGSAGDPVSRTAEPAVRQARLWLADRFGNAGNHTSPGLGWTTRLVGLGPGLTPSGDDFLAGAMIAARVLGEPRVSQELWHHIRPLADRATNGISITYLEAAAQGWGNAPLHDLLCGLLRGDATTVRDAMQALDRIGHTSGWDAAAGAVMTLEAWHLSRAKGQRNASDG